MGAENALIVSSENISKESFIAFFEAMDCQWYSGHKDEAIILDDYTPVGICLMHNSYNEMFDSEDIEAFTAALGDKPKTFFEINRTKDDDPNELYLKVAKRMAKKWRVIVYDIQGNIVPCEVLCR